MSPWLEDTGVGFQTSLCIYLVAEREVWIVHKFNRGEGRKASQDAPPSSSAPVQAPKKLPQGAVARQTGVWAQKFLRAANHRPRSRGRKSHGARSTRQPWSAARKGGWWDPVRLLYDVKSSWSATAAAGQGRGLLHHQPSARHHLWERAQPPFPRSGFQAQQSKPRQSSPPAVPGLLAPADSTTTSNRQLLLRMAILHHAISVGFCAHWSETFRHKTRT